MKLLCFVSALCLLVASRSQAGDDTFEYGLFGTVTLYHATPRPSHVVLFASGDGGWNLGVIDMAKALMASDALVVGVDYPRYRRALEASHEVCAYPPGDFELLSRAVQKNLGFEEYVTPVLVGYSSGASLAYALLVQAPPNTFRGAISLGFCPELPLGKRLCRENGLRSSSEPDGKGQRLFPSEELEVPWVALQGAIDEVCNADSTVAFVREVPNGQVVVLPKVGHGFSVQKNWMPQFDEAFAGILKTPDAGVPPPPRVASLSDLPLAEVPATEKKTDAMAVIISGDGGWSVTEKALSAELAAAGVPVVGLNSLHYFWKRRTPDSAAADLERILDHYAAAWHASEIVLIGYSMGAGVLPFMADRLPDAWRSRIAQVILLGPEEKVDFEFHLTDWLGNHPHASALPVLPEVEKLKGLDIVCIYGADEKDCLCRALPGGLATVIERPGGHRVGTGIEPIMKAILEADARRSGRH